MYGDRFISIKVILFKVWVIGLNELYGDFCKSSVENSSFHCKNSTFSSYVSSARKFVGWTIFVPGGHGGVQERFGPKIPGIHEDQMVGIFF